MISCSCHRDGSPSSMPCGVASKSGAGSRYAVSRRLFGEHGSRTAFCRALAGRSLESMHMFVIDTVRDGGTPFRRRERETSKLTLCP